uniref:Uncharacterized protein n=1 Tax=Picea glauca TaxID=3330 RepID=A0A117NIG1_PICGL|nr:hypothetical protein ABT39_MTgene3135 [Picea glauca]
MFGFALIPRPPDGLIGLAARFLSRWSRVRCLTLALLGSLEPHFKFPLPLVESSLPHPRPSPLSARPCLGIVLLVINYICNYAFMPSLYT